jgi:hypothetical protein
MSQHEVTQRHNRAHLEEGNSDFQRHRSVANKTESLPRYRERACKLEFFCGTRPIRRFPWFQFLEKVADEMGPRMRDPRARDTFVV